ncbi:hypothetical protein PACTADRAFT_87068 [Pachysolen tannophilus NRRL Y-2460]|uniref:Uncharacterized protein n=1 Tax=Pachysolen tannophilus NRRL Y-2460 TaxID=669874 RepID=A0A1E4TN52_PACTA|nr:hypothetical protein PACTADRAFT_87068 [Pachysolen tannophilus NRRL Y-2460]
MELLNACKILDLLGNSYHDKLLNWFINNQLKEIQSIFKSTEEAGSLENLSRRYIFFRRVFKNVELRYSSKFPSEWNILYQLSDRFCYFTKQDLKEVLQKESKNINVNLLLNSLSETLEFENFLNMKFKFKNILVNKNINQEKKEINFDKQISSVFEPYLNVWLDHQEKIINDKFLEFLNPSKLLENNDGSDEHHEQDENSLNILTSSADLFRIYRSLLSQLSKLSTGEPLLKLSAIFVKYLNKYHDLILKPIIPDFKTIKNNNEEENQQVLTYACLVLNTADYCSLTISQLQERLTSLINEKFSSKVEQNFSKVKEVFMQLINECLNLLVFKISEDLSLQWRTMINLNWKNLNSVEDSSSYTSDISKTINSNCIVIFEKINRVIYTKNFMNKLVELISYSFLINMIKLKPINEVMSEQFLLDIQVLKKNLINLPELYKQQEELSSKAYIRFINQSLGNIENILKLLLIQFKPIDNFVMNYFFIIGDRNFNNFIKILKIKGILPTSAQNINFNRVELSKYSKTFEEKLTKYEDNLIDADDNNISTGNGNKSLVGSLKFLENLNVDQIDYNYDNYPPWLINSKTSTNSVASPNSPALKGFPSISIPFGNTPSNNNSNNNNNNNTSNNSNSTTANGQNGGEPIKNLITRKDAVEKNLAKTIDNMKFNDNFKNFGKFFKRND